MLTRQASKMSARLSFRVACQVPEHPPPGPWPRQVPVPSDVRFLLRCAPLNALQDLLYFVRAPWPWGKPHEAAGLHHPCRQRGVRVADCGGGAAAGDAGDWISETVTSDGGAALLILRRRPMIRKTLIICALSVSSFITTAVAEQSSTRVSISDDVVKIGVLNDMSSLYSDATGKGSLTAAQMAVADFGGSVKGKPIEVISADH